MLFFFVFCNTLCLIFDYLISYLNYSKLNTADCKSSFFHFHRSSSSIYSHAAFFLSSRFKEEKQNMEVELITKDNELEATGCGSDDEESCGSCNHGHGMVIGYAPNGGTFPAWPFADSNTSNSNNSNSNNSNANNENDGATNDEDEKVNDPFLKLLNEETVEYKCIVTARRGHFDEQLKLFTSDQRAQHDEMMRSMTEVDCTRVLQDRFEKAQSKDMELFCALEKIIGLNIDILGTNDALLNKTQQLIKKCQLQNRTVKGISDRMDKLRDKVENQQKTVDIARRMKRRATDARDEEKKAHDKEKVKHEESKKQLKKLQEKNDIAMKTNEKLLSDSRNYKREMDHQKKQLKQLRKESRELSSNLNSTTDKLRDLKKELREAKRGRSGNESFSRGQSGYPNSQSRSQSHSHSHSRDKHSGHPNHTHSYSSFSHSHHGYRSHSRSNKSYRDPSYR